MDVQSGSLNDFWRNIYIPTWTLSLCLFLVEIVHICLSFQTLLNLPSLCRQQHWQLRPIYIFLWHSHEYAFNDTTRAHLCPFLEVVSWRNSVLRCLTPPCVLSRKKYFLAASLTWRLTGFFPLTTKKLSCQGPLNLSEPIPAVVLIIIWFVFIDWNPLPCRPNHLEWESAAFFPTDRDKQARIVKKFHVQTHVRQPWSNTRVA